MILLGIFALIFSVNRNKTESTAGNEGNFNAEGIVNGDKGYISSAQIIQTKTGTGPFDENNDPGNDKDENNNIVRSFDQVSWTIDLTMALKTGIAETGLKGGIINIEATLPEACANVMKWDLSSMNWIVNGKVSSDGRTVTGQYNMSETETTIPGKQTVVFVLQVYGAGNGTEIIPTFTFDLEGNDEQDKVSINGDAITVSAVGKYNVKLARNTRSNTRAVDLNYNGESIDGRVYGYAFVLQLYNDNASKGLKGVEYPKGDITFDIDLTMQRSKLGTSELEDITDEANVILWNYKVNYGNEVLPNRSMNFSGLLINNDDVPGGMLASNRKNSVYNSGNITMNQNGSNISVTVNNYGFDGVFPQYDKSYIPENSIDYTQNIGCFSVGYFQLIVPDNEATTVDNRNYYLKVADSNFKATSVTDINVTNQMVTNDDSDSLTHVRYAKGSFDHHIYLFNESGELLSSNWNMGDSVRAKGQEFTAGSYIDIGLSNDPDDYIRSVDRFFKFDGEAFEVIDYSDDERVHTVGMDNMNWKYWYVTKKDGTNWESQTDMNNGKIEDMLLYENKEDIPDNYTCIGVYIESQEGYITVPLNYDVEYFIIRLKVKDTAVINTTYGLTQTSKYWREALDRSIYTQEKLDSYDTYSTPTWNSGYRNYIKTEYDKDGNIIAGTHSGGYSYGQTVLIVGANLSGKIRAIYNGVEKENYDLGINENVVTYSVEPTLSNYTASSLVENATLKAEVTIPKGLEYVFGSSKRVGDSYDEPDITSNSDGSTTLVWYFYNCDSGEAITPITFDANIDNETANGTQYEAKLVVSEEIGEDGVSKIGNSKIDFRTSTVSINVINLASHRLYKEIETPVIEKNGQVKYKIVYSNNTDEALPEFQLLDILPYNNDNRGSNFEGSYTVNNINVNQTISGVTQSNSNLTLYTTNSTTVRNMDATNTGIGTDSIWTSKTIGSTLNERATGFAIKGQLAGRAKLEIEITLNTNGNVAENIYANNAMAQVYANSEQMQTGAVKSQVVSRKIKGKVWDDANRNGVIDDGEAYIQGTTLKLLNSANNTQIATTTTNANGEYEFNNLDKGLYKVEVAIDDLHELTDKEVGTNREINSKFNKDTKQTDEITRLNTISAPEIIEDNVNAGIRKIQFNITTKVEGTGGNISGEGEDVYESVDKGQDSKKDIVATPDKGFRVDTITVNGELIQFTEEEDHSVILDKFINMQEDKEVVVTFKDVRTSVLVHHYKENTTEKLSEDVLINGEIGDNYTTQVASDIPVNYEVINATPEKYTGTMTQEQIVVTYYYNLKEPTITSQNITKNATPTIENLTDEITYNISYKVSLIDYIGDAEVTIVDTLPYGIDISNSDIANGTYNSQNNTITWVETIKDINSYENKNSDITINKTIKVVYTGINQGTTDIENRVTGSVKTKTPEKEFEGVEASADTTTEFIVNIPVSKIWDDEDNKLNQRPTRVVFKLTGSDGSERTLELAKPGTLGATTTQDSNNPNKWNDIFKNLPKYDSSNNEIVYTLTEVQGDMTYYEATVDEAGRNVTNTNKYGKVTVHHYIMNTDGSTTTTKVPDVDGVEIPDGVIEGKEGDSYTTSEASNVNEKYELVQDATVGETNGTIQKYNEEKPQEVIYYYRLKPAKVIIHYLEKDSNQVLATNEQIIGHVDDQYNTDTEHRKETIEKDGNTYTLVSNSGNTTGTMTVADTNVTYYYLQNTKATVRYVERNPETHAIVKDLETPTTKEGLVGDEFVTNEKAFLGYKLVEAPENKTITMTKEEQTLIYYYEPVYTGLVENHIDDVTGAVLDTQTHQVQVGQPYNIPSKDFAGYDLVESKLPDNASGTMGEELVTVNYYYIKKAVLEVNYVDKLTGEPLTEQIVDNTKHEGDLYTTEQKSFENYDLVEVPANASGTIQVETDGEGNIINNKTVVTYYYIQRAVVEEHHIDILTNKDIEKPTIYNGHVGDNYSTTSKEFLSYQLAETDKEGNSLLPTNATGTMTENKIVVNYYYYQPAKVIVHYVDRTTGKELEETNSETGEVQSSQVVIEGRNGEAYETTAKEFEYYTLVESPAEPNGTMIVEITKDEDGKDVVNNTIDVYYYYEPKPFNIGVEKEITGIIVNGERRSATNGKLEKVDIYRKSTENTSVQVEYKITVKNTGEVAGRATIEDKLPEGMSLANNDGTWEVNNGTLTKVIPEIGAGETKEYTVLLNWNTSGANMGNKVNEVSLVGTENVPGFKDNNDKDNTDQATVSISVETGELPVGLLIALAGLVALESVTLRYAVILTKRQKKNNKMDKK